jgi:hypothetical protein
LTWQEYYQFDETATRRDGPTPQTKIFKTKHGYSETVKQLQGMLTRTHPQNRTAIEEELNLAIQNQGPTVFDWLIDMIRKHDKVHLTLE